jgi:hypothetical protein
MLKNKTCLETEIEGKVHCYSCEINTQIGHAIQALDTFRSYLYGRQKEQEEAQAAAAKAAEQPTEQPTEQPKVEG